MGSKHPVQVIAVTGGKGGIGKTNVSVNLSLALAEMGRRVVLLDADLGLANVDVLLGLKPKATLADVLEGDGTIPTRYIGQAFGYLVGYVGATLSVALWLFEDRELT